MNTLQLLAGLLIAVAGLKLIVVLVDPQRWLAWVRRLDSNPARVSVLALSAAMIVLALLIAAGVSIVEILAVSLFVSLLVMAGLAPYIEPLLEWVMRQDLAAMVRSQWLYASIWLVLLLWGVWAIVTGD